MEIATKSLAKESPASSPQEGSHLSICSLPQKQLVVQHCQSTLSITVNQYTQCQRVPPFKMGDFVTCKFHQPKTKRKRRRSRSSSSCSSSTGLESRSHPTQKAGQHTQDGKLIEGSSQTPVLLSSLPFLQCACAQMCKCGTAWGPGREVTSQGR